MASIKLSIAEPCHENWNAMLFEDKGRFCLSCQKTVVDFTAMNDRQVFDYFKNYKGDTCGQLSNDQLNRELTKPKTHSIGRWKYFWQILLPAFFAFQKLEAQPKMRGKVAATPVCKPVKEEPPTRLMGMVMPHQVAKPVDAKIITGKIVDDKKQALPFASIASSDGRYEVADSVGNFKITVAEKAILTISHVGFNQTIFTLDSLQTNEISALKFENGRVMVETMIELKPVVLSTPDVTVVGYTGTIGKMAIAGGITSVRSRMLSKSPKLIKPITDQPQIKIFPNPIKPGQSFQVSIQTKKTGTYLLKIVNAAGSVLVENKINMTSKNQTEMVHGAALQQAGIYFIAVINPTDKKGQAISGRIVVQ